MKTVLRPVALLLVSALVATSVPADAFLAVQRAAANSSTRVPAQFQSQALVQMAVAARGYAVNARLGARTQRVVPAVLGSRLPEMTKGTITPQELYAGIPMPKHLIVPLLGAVAVGLVGNWVGGFMVGAGIAVIAAVVLTTTFHGVRRKRAAAKELKLGDRGVDQEISALIQQYVSDSPVGHRMDRVPTAGPGHSVIISEPNLRAEPIVDVPSPDEPVIRARLPILPSDPSEFPEEAHLGRALGEVVCLTANQGWVRATPTLDLQAPGNLRIVRVGSRRYLVVLTPHRSTDFPNSDTIKHLFSNGVAEEYESSVGQLKQTMSHEMGSRSYTKAVVESVLGSMSLLTPDDQYQLYVDTLVSIFMTSPELALNEKAWRHAMINASQKAGFSGGQLVGASFETRIRDLAVAAQFLASERTAIKPVDEIVVDVGNRPEKNLELYPERLELRVDRRPINLKYGMPSSGVQGDIRRLLLSKEPPAHTELRETLVRLAETCVLILRSDIPGGLEAAYALAEAVPPHQEIERVYAGTPTVWVLEELSRWGLIPQRVDADKIRAYQIEEKNRVPDLDQVVAGGLDPLEPTQFAANTGRHFFPPPVETKLLKDRTTNAEAKRRLIDHIERRGPLTQHELEDLTGFSHWLSNALLQELVDRDGKLAKEGRLFNISRPLTASERYEQQQTLLRRLRREATHAFKAVKAAARLRAMAEGFHNGSSTGPDAVTLDVVTRRQAQNDADDRTLKWLQEIFAMLHEFDLVAHWVTFDYWISPQWARLNGGALRSLASVGDALLERAAEKSDNVLLWDDFRRPKYGFDPTAVDHAQAALRFVFSDQQAGSQRTRYLRDTFRYWYDWYESDARRRDAYGRRSIFEAMCQYGLDRLENELDQVLRKLQETSEVHPAPSEPQPEAATLQAESLREKDIDVVSLAQRHGVGATTRHLNEVIRLPRQIATQIQQLVDAGYPETGQIIAGLRFDGTTPSVEALLREFLLAGVIGDRRAQSALLKRAFLLRDAAELGKAEFGDARRSGSDRLERTLRIRASRDARAIEDVTGLSAERLAGIPWVDRATATGTENPDVLIDFVIAQVLGNAHSTQRLRREVQIFYLRAYADARGHGVFAAPQERFFGTLLGDPLPLAGFDPMELMRMNEIIMQVAGLRAFEKLRAAGRLTAENYSQFNKNGIGGIFGWYSLRNEVLESADYQDLDLERLLDHVEREGTRPLHPDADGELARRVATGPFSATIPVEANADETVWQARTPSADQGVLLFIERHANGWRVRSDPLEALREEIQLAHSGPLRNVRAWRDSFGTLRLRATLLEGDQFVDEHLILEPTQVTHAGPQGLTITAATEIHRSPDKDSDSTLYFGVPIPKHLILPLLGAVAVGLVGNWLGSYHVGAWLAVLTMVAWIVMSHRTQDANRGHSARGMKRRAFLQGAIAGSVIARAVRAAPAKDDPGLAQFWGDLAELPPNVLARLKKKAQTQKWTASSFLKQTILYETNRELMKAGFYIHHAAVKNPRPEFARGPIGVRAAVFHLSPDIEERKVEGKTIRAHEVMKVSGLQTIAEYNGFSPLESQDDIFWFGQGMRAFRDLLVEMRLDRRAIEQETSMEKKNALKLKALERLKPYIMIPDPLAYDILEDTFGTLNPEEILALIRERVILHETLHALLEPYVQRSNDPAGNNVVAERSAYLGNVVFALHPYYQLLYLANQMYADAYHVRKRPAEAQLFSETFGAIEDIFAALMTAFVGRGGVRGDDLRAIMRIEKSEERALATIKLFKKYKLTEQDIRDLARTTFERTYGKAPTLKLAEIERPLRLLAGQVGVPAGGPDKKSELGQLSISREALIATGSASLLAIGLGLFFGGAWPLLAVPAGILLYRMSPRGAAPLPSLLVAVAQRAWWLMLGPIYVISGLATGMGGVGGLVPPWSRNKNTESPPLYRIESPVTLTKGAGHKSRDLDRILLDLAEVTGSNTFEYLERSLEWVNREKTAYDLMLKDQTPDVPLPVKFNRPVVRRSIEALLQHIWVTRSGDIRARDDRESMKEYVLMAKRLRVDEPFFVDLVYQSLLHGLGKTELARWSFSASPFIKPALVDQILRQLSGDQSEKARFQAVGVMGQLIHAGVQAVLSPSVIERFVRSGGDLLFRVYEGKDRRLFTGNELFSILQTAVERNPALASDDGFRRLVEEFRSKLDSFESKGDHRQIFESGILDARRDLEHLDRTIEKSSQASANAHRSKTGSKGNDRADQDPEAGQVTISHDALVATGSASLLAIGLGLFFGGAWPLLAVPAGVLLSWWMGNTRRALLFLPILVLLALSHVNAAFGFQAAPAPLRSVTTQTLPAERPSHWMAVLRDPGRTGDHERAVLQLANWLPAAWDDIPRTRQPFVQEIGRDSRLLQLLEGFLAVNQTGGFKRRVIGDAARILSFTPIEDSERLARILEALVRLTARDPNRFSLFYREETRDLLIMIQRLVSQNSAGLDAGFRVGQRLMDGTLTVRPEEEVRWWDALLMALSSVKGVGPYLKTHPDALEMALRVLERHKIDVGTPMTSGVLSLVTSVPQPEVRRRVGAVLQAVKKQSSWWSPRYEVTASYSFEAAARFAEGGDALPPFDSSEMKRMAVRLKNSNPEEQRAGLAYFRGLFSGRRDWANPPGVILMDWGTPEGIERLRTWLRGEDLGAAAGAAAVLAFTPIPDEPILEAVVTEAEAAVGRIRYQRKDRTPEVTAQALRGAAYHLRNRPGRTGSLLRRLHAQLRRDQLNPKRPDSALPSETRDLVRLLNAQPDIDAVLARDPAAPGLIYQLLRRLPISGNDSEEIIDLAGRCPTPEMLASLELFLSEPPLPNFRFMAPGLFGEGGGLYYFPLRLAERVHLMRKEVAVLYADASAPIRTEGVVGREIPTAAPSLAATRASVAAGMVRHQEHAAALMGSEFLPWLKAVTLLSLSDDASAVRLLVESAARETLSDKRAIVMQHLAVRRVGQLRLTDDEAVAALGLEGVAEDMYRRRHVAVFNAPDERTRELAGWLQETLATSVEAIQFFTFIEPQRMLIPDGFPDDGATRPGMPTRGGKRDRKPDDPTRILGAYNTAYQSVRLALQSLDQFTTPFIEVVSHEAGHGAWNRLGEEGRRELVNRYKRSRGRIRSLWSTYAAEGSQFDDTDEARAEQTFAEVWRLYRHHPEKLFTNEIQAAADLHSFIEAVASDFVRMTSEGKRLQLFFPGAAQTSDRIPGKDFSIDDTPLTYSRLRSFFQSLPSTAPLRPSSKAAQDSPRGHKALVLAA